MFPNSYLFRNFKQHQNNYKWEIEKKTNFVENYNYFLLQILVLGLVVFISN